MKNISSILIICLFLTLSIFVLFKYNTHFRSSMITTTDAQSKIFHVTNEKCIFEYNGTTFLVNIKDKNVLLLSNNGIHFLNLLMWPADGYTGVDLLDKVKCEYDNEVKFEKDKVMIKFYLNQTDYKVLNLKIKFEK